MSPTVAGPFFSGLHRLEEWLACIFLFALLFFACLHIGLRFFATSSPPWLEPLLPHLVVWCGMIGALIAVREGKHIVIDLLPKKRERWWHAFLTLWKSALSALVCAALFVSCGSFVLDEKTFGSLFYGTLPMWPFLVIFPVCFLLMSARYLYQSWESSVALFLTNQHGWTIRAGPNDP